MGIPKIHEGEYRFCLILWKHEPVTAAQLAKLCQEQLGWKRTTTYTIIKRLGERGILKNENGLVTALVSRDESTSWSRKSSRGLCRPSSPRLPGGRICRTGSWTRSSR